MDGNYGPYKTCVKNNPLPLFSSPTENHVPHHLTAHAYVLPTKLVAKDPLVVPKA